MITCSNLNSNLLSCRERKRKESFKWLSDWFRGRSSLSRVITRSQSTIKKEQIALLLSQIMLVLCIYILVSNIPPIVFGILTETNIFALGEFIVILIAYFAVLAFTSMWIILPWKSIYTRYKKQLPKKITVWIEKDNESKFRRLGQIIDRERRTIVLCDSRKIGHSLDIGNGISFVSYELDETKRSEIIRSNKVIAVTRPVYAGLDMNGVEVIILFDFLTGSISQLKQMINRRRQEIEYSIITTASEYTRYSRRMYEIYSMGIDIIIRWKGSNEIS